MVMKEIYVIVKPLQGTRETKSLKVIEVVNNELVVILDDYIVKGEEVKDCTWKSITNYITSKLNFNTDVEFVNL